MAKVQGVKEKLHSPVYDAFFVKADQTKTFKDFMTDPRVIRFFVDVQNKTKLETNLQAAGVLPSLNTFEARAMRVVASSTFCVSREALNAPTVRKEIVAAADVYHGSSGDTAAQDTLVNTIRDKIEVVTGVAAVINKQIRADIVNVAEEYKAITTPSQPE